MVDIWTPEKRSAVMARIRGVTLPEKRLRAKLVQMRIKGFKISPKIEGINPDLLFFKAKVVVFVDGCFWHGCPRCYVEPKTRVEYWQSKAKKNQARDRRQERLLRKSGWKIVRLWECQIEKKLMQQVRKVVRAIQGMK
jgi:DNA mismatch endonuclease, patch repair protein